MSKRFGATVAVDDVSIQFAPGEIHALTGEHGAGKSTIVAMLSGVIQPTSGRVVVGDRTSLASPAEANRAGIAATCPDRVLIKQLTVAQNIDLGLQNDRRASLSAHKQRVAARSALATIGLEINPDLIVGKMSLADQQMVAIAKALASNARLLILDEATEALTGHETDRLFGSLLEIGKRGITVLYVSWRLSELTALADRITVLREGRLQATLAVEELTGRRSSRCGALLRRAKSHRQSWPEA